MIRIGEINYLNCTPIFTMLRERFPDSGYSFEPGHPSLLNSRLRTGEVDLCPSSSIEYARNPDKYLILPELSISADGPVKSVLLFSRVPVEELDGASIALTNESETSVALLKILLAKRYSFANSFTVVSAGVRETLKDYPAVLMIGDRALREAKECGSSCHVYDLGELWKEFTGYPFVFALWLAREDALLREGDALRLLRDRLIESKKAALENIEEIAVRHAQNGWTNREYLINYWQVISYELSPRHLAGLGLYFGYAAEIGILESAPEIRLLI